MGGQITLPPGPAADQLAWVLRELTSDQTTTPSEISQDFDSRWTLSTAQTQSFFFTLRTTYPNALVKELIGLTPMRAVAITGTPGVATSLEFLRLDARHTGAHSIHYLSVSGFSGTVQYPEDRTLSPTAAADKLVSLASATGLYVGRISGGRCTPTLERRATQLRATASVFKLRRLDGVADALACSRLGIEQLIRSTPRRSRPVA